MKEIAITENHLYLKAYKNGGKIMTRTVAVYVLKDYASARLKKENPEKKYINRIGLTASVKLGGAVTRNRMKRVMREGLRHIEKCNELKKGFLIVIAARSECAKAKTQEVEKDLMKAFTALGMFAGMKTPDSVKGKKRPVANGAPGQLPQSVAAPNAGSGAENAADTDNADAPKKEK